MRDGNAMDRLLKMARELARTREHWTLADHAIDVQLGRGSRHQRVRLSRVVDYYVITSVVLGTEFVTQSNRRWNELAMIAWQRNAEHELVTFAFDGRDRLVGQIRHPAEHLDTEELELYIDTLARECDRFEYILRGDDRF